MACFKCNQPGHWARYCPNATKASSVCFKCNQSGHWVRDCTWVPPVATIVCKFCNDKGHQVDECPLENKYKPKKQDSVVSVSRTRSRQFIKSIDDILYENHMSTKPSYKVDVDAFVKSQFTKQGMIDDHALAAAVFKDTVVNLADDGHLHVLGHIAGKYCEASNSSIKEFLRKMEKEINDFSKFKEILRSRFFMCPFMKDGIMHFRKFSGYCV